MQVCKIKAFIIIAIFYLNKSSVAATSPNVLNTQKNGHIEQLSKAANKFSSTTSDTPVKHSSTYEIQGSFPLLPLKSVSPFPDSETKSTKITPSWSN